MTEYNYSDAPRDIGRHPDYSLGFEGNQLVGTVCPDLAGMIDQANGWWDAKDLSESERLQRYQDAADVLHPLLCYLMSGKTVHSVGLRCISLCMAVRPELGGFENVTAAARHFQITKQALSKYTGYLFELCGGLFQHKNAMHGTARRALKREQAIAQWRLTSQPRPRRNKPRTNSKGRLMSALLVDP